MRFAGYAIKRVAFFCIEVFSVFLQEEGVFEGSALVCIGLSLASLTGNPVLGVAPVLLMCLDCCEL